MEPVVSEHPLIDVFRHWPVMDSYSVKCIQAPEGFAAFLNAPVSQAAEEEMFIGR